MSSNRYLLNFKHFFTQTPTRLTFFACLLLSLVTGSWALHRAAFTAYAQSDNPAIGPGIPNVGSNAPRSNASSSKAGSVLFFHKYTSSTGAPSNVNTLVTLTNTHPTAGIAVRLSWIHGCVVDTTFITLGGNQTRTLLASSENPNQTGYLMAMAVSSSGFPLQFNWLLGSASYRDARGFEVTYNALAVAKRTSGPARSVGTNLSEILFNNTEYDRLPKQIAVDNLQNQDPNATGGDAAVKTDVMVYSPLSTLASAGTQGLKFDAVLLDQSGRPYPKVVESGCGVNATVVNVWNDAPFNSVVTPQRQGYATFAAKVDTTSAPVLGMSLTEGVTSAWHSARQMQALSLLDSFKMTVPVLVPPSAPNDPVTTNQPDAVGGATGASESKAGSLLFFSRFASGVYGNTRLSLTNTHPTLRARLRIFFTGLVEPALMNEYIIILQPNQTTTLNVNEFAANQKGWVMATAIDGRAQPFQYNYLIGSAVVNEQTTGLVTGYNALALSKNLAGAAARNSDGITTDLIFDDTNYDRLPATLGLNGVPNQQDNTTTFGFARPPLSILEAPNTRGSLGVTLYDDLLASFGATLGQLEVKLGNVRNNAQAPPITNTIQKGHRGWFKVNSSAPIFAWFNNLAGVRFSTAEGAWTGGFNGGANLHVLTLADTYLLRTPGNNPNNRPPEADFEPIDAVMEARWPNGINVRLDGRVSSDPDGEDDPLSFKWFDNEKQVSIAKVSDYRFALGTHILKLNVLDGNNTPSEPKLYYFQVNDTQPPIMSGIPSNITKTVSSSAGIGLNYTLPVAYDFVDGKVSVTASKAPGSLFPIGKTTVIFTARDNAGNVSTAKMDVTINKGSGTLPTQGGVPGNILPIMSNLNDQYVVVGKTKTITLQAQDDNNDGVSFQLLNAPAYARIDNPDPVNRTAKLIIAPVPGGQPAATGVRVVATDSRGGVLTSLPFRIQISDTETDENGTGLGPAGPDDPGTGVGGGGGGGGGTTNKPPVAKMVALPATAQATLKQGAIVKLDGSPSSDPDLDVLTYVWKDKGVPFAEGALVDATLAVGIHVITLTVADPKGATSTSDPSTIEVLPRPLTVVSASPAKIPLFNQVTMTITGTGFFANSDPNLATKVRFDCSSFCSGGSQVQVTITNIEEDTITLTAKTTQNTPFGNRDCIVTNPNGTSVKLSRSNLVSK